MRRLLCTALFLLCCAYGCIAAVVQPLPQRGQGPWDTYTLSVTDSEKKKDFKPIRFAVSAKEIDRVLKYCKQSDVDLDEDQEEEYDAEYDDTKEYGFPLDPEEINEFCEGQNEVKLYVRKTLLRDVLPAALKLHSERLRVEQVHGKLILPFVREKEYPYLSECPNVSIPKEHRDGIPDADFMLYVGLIPSADSTNSVKICSYNDQKRPTSALIKFVPKEIVDTRHFIRLTAHEVAHALGFDIETMKEHKVIVEENTGKKVLLVESNDVIEKMKAQYACANDNEIKSLVFENDRGEADPLHWKRLIAKDELMSTYSSSSNGMFYTALTLSVFDSMPFYKANFKMAENMSWGKDAGCDFLKGGNKEEYKQTKSSKYSEMFCDEVNPALQCTSDRFSLGMCSMKPSGVEIPDDYAMYFGTVLYNSDNDLMDGYHIIKPIPKTNCEEDEFKLIPGSILSNISRCLKGENLKLKEPDGKPPVGDICAKVKCENNKVSVQYSGSDKWHVCEDGKIEVTDGQEFQSGSILCPNYTEVCNDFSEVKDINFTIEYDEDEKERIKKEKEQEKNEMEEEEKQRSEAEAEADEQTRRESQQREKEREKEKGKETAKQPEPSPPTDLQQVQQSHTQPNPRENPTSDVTVEHGGSAVAGNANGTSHVPTAPSQAEDQRDSAGGGKEEVALPHPAVPEPQLEREEKQAHENSNNNNTGGLQPQQPTLSAQENSSEPVKKPEVEKKPTSEISKPVVSEPIAVSEDTPSKKEEDHNNTTENIEQVQETITESPSQNGNDEGINTTVDTTHSPNSPATDDEKEGGVNADNNTTNTTTSSIPENVNASAAPATLTELNNTQVGQVINEATTIAIVGADSSIATSYQIPLLLIVSALVALASP
ncbi:surface protease GP63 [Trypanosoma theileri]|uniref:Leishmanolysin-like peptidase n=1 Tax=Trypanosoma theileri TaxID=67003 RepID=A0A1X0NH86_9TRYP|nr:surface protease GP63 [Trypanosoma theileri]ORC83450.1 surface protease GP63 [Trypanosoma theileri]